jgi:hypothetical protein
MKIAAGLLCLCALLACSGCFVVATGVVAAVVVSATAEKTPGQNTGPATGRAVESPARLSKQGMVVVVDAGSGATTELPWHAGMLLSTAAQAAHFGGSVGASIFRAGKVLTVERTQVGAGTAGPELRAGDVVELRR